MSDSIKKSYFFWLKPLKWFNNTRKTYQFVAYCLLSLLLFHSVSAARVRRKATRHPKSRNSSSTSSSKKSKRSSYLKNTKRLKVKRNRKENSQKTSSSSKPAIPPAYDYVTNVIENEYKVSLEKTKDKRELLLGSYQKVLLAAFESVWRGPMEKSLNQFMPILWDEGTRKALDLFVGPEKYESQNGIKKIATTLGQVNNPMALYMIFLDLLGANVDWKIIQYRIKQLQALKSNSEVTYQLCDLLNEYYVAFYRASTHLASDKIPLRCKNYMDLFQGDGMKHFTKSSILMFVEKKLGSPASDAAKKNPYASFFFRFLLIELGWIEALYRLKYVWDNVKKLVAIWSNFSYNFWFQFKYRDEDIQMYNPQQHALPLGRTIHFRVLRFCTRSPKFASFVALPPHLILNFLQEFLPGSIFYTLDLFWYFCKDIYRNGIRLFIITNDLIDLLHGMRDTVTLMKKIKKILQENPDLRRFFVVEYGQIKRFTNLKKTKKFRMLLDKMAKVRRTPITLGFVFRPWNLLPTRLMALYTKILQEPEEVNELFRAAQFATLKVLYAAIKTKAVLLSHGESTPYPICLANIKEAQNLKTTQLKVKKPSMSFEDIYTPMLYGSNKKIVKNSIKIGGKNKNAIVMGPNKSGKSVLLKSVGFSTVTATGMGIAFASSCDIDVLPRLIIFDANASDNIVAQTSHFQEEILRYEKLLVILKQYKLPILIIYDEKLDSTYPKEATPLLTVMLGTLEKEEGTSMLVASHFRDIYDYKTYLDQFKFMHTEYKKGTGFTFKIRDGRSQDPSAVYTLMDMNFHQETFNKFIEMLRKDPTYEFKHKLPGYKKAKQKKKISKVLRVLLYIMLILGLLGLAFLFLRRFKVTMKLEKRDKSKKKARDELDWDHWK